MITRLCSRLSDFALLLESSLIIIFSTSSLFFPKVNFGQPWSNLVNRALKSLEIAQNLLLPDPRDSDSSPHHFSMIYPFSFHLMTCHLSISLPRGQDDYIIEFSNLDSSDFLINTYHYLRHLCSHI